VIQNPGEAWVYCGDLAYARENLTGVGGSGTYTPVGFAAGTQFNVIKSYDEMLEIVSEKLDHVIIGHENDSWELYPTWQTASGLHAAEVTLAPGEASRARGK
jgi:hypothetical protein